MRTTSTVLLTTFLASAMLGAPAVAQVQQGSPNAANQSLSNESQMRTTQQNQTSQSNMNQMNLERSQAATPPPSGGTGPIGIRGR